MASKSQQESRAVTSRPRRPRYNIWFEQAIVYRVGQKKVSLIIFAITLSTASQLS